MRIGIDVGGTKIEIAALDSSGAIALRERIDTPAGSYEAIVAAIAGLVEMAEARLRVRASVGLGIPGTISPATGLVKNANSTRLNGKPFDTDLATVLKRPVRIANDANCFALSEASDGAGAGYGTVFGIIAGTGVGGGIVIAGKVLTGRHAIGGEWGHNSLPWRNADEIPGPRCYCGRLGCIEAFLSGPGLENDHKARAGTRMASADIARAAEGGDAAAAETMNRFFDRFARALSGVINILDPDCVVIGGGLSNIEALYRELPKRIPAYVFSDVCGTPVLRNIHGDSSGVRGAAWLWGENEAPNP